MKARQPLLLMVLISAALISADSALADFSQQGPKLVGTGASGTAEQGYAVALSADGNTAIVGGSFDNGQAGAAWIWTRSAGVWTQQGPMLFGSGSAGSALQGISVALSADGNTAIVGGIADDNFVGAAWVWTRSAGVWTQQGAKLVGSGSTFAAQQGSSVSLSADGNTALIGAPGDGPNAGAAWVWTRNAGVWHQQGAKLVGSGSAANDANQGSSVCLSADGNTAIVGGNRDANLAGAAWIWTRSAGVWHQQGGKLVGSGAVGNAAQAWSVSVSADGNTAIAGGLADGGATGAAWVWTRSAGVWTQQGDKLVGSGAVRARQGFSVSLSADGNTAVVGAESDDKASAWIWTRTAGAWSQQGDKLVGSGAAVGFFLQGSTVALSADASTVIVGGFDDDGLTGAVWLYAAAPPCPSGGARRCVTPVSSGAEATSGSRP